MPVYFAIFLMCFSLIFFAEDVFGKRAFLIMVPSECVVIERIEKNKVFVVDDLDAIKKGVCNRERRNISFRNIIIDDEKVEFVEVYYNGRMWKRFNVKEILSSDSVLTQSVDMFRKEVSALVDNVGSGLSNETLSKIQEEAKKAERYVQSEEFQEKVEFFKDYLGRLLLGDFYDDLLEQKRSKSKGSSVATKERGVKGDGLDVKNISKLSLFDHERIYIFVSSSLPDEVMSSYVRAVDELKEDKIVFVLRGAVGGMTYIGPTVNWVMKYMLKDQKCVVSEGRVIEGCRLYSVRFIIDPLLYRKYRIDKVPAILYVSGVKPFEDFSEGLDVVSFERAIVSYGDVDFYYHLYQIGKVTRDKRFLNLAKEKLRYSFEIIEDK
ncbi:MAG: TrbC family F-type conjugative pilus assembly protein [Zestosphaera sp.]